MTYRQAGKAKSPFFVGISCSVLYGLMITLNHTGTGRSQTFFCHIFFNTQLSTFFHSFDISLLLGIYHLFFLHRLLVHFIHTMSVKSFILLHPARRSSLNFLLLVQGCIILFLLFMMRHGALYNKANPPSKRRTN